VPHWKYVTCVALLLYCAGIIFFALHPVEDIKWGEWVSVVLSVIAQIGLLAYAFPNVRLPGEEYAFLIVGYVGFITLLFYLLDTADDPTRRAGIALFLMSGAVAGYGAFLAQDQWSERDRDG
jgi:hypothetical protein